MPRTRVRSRVRRSLIVLVDGLAIWALAVLLASYAGEPSLTGRGATPLVAIIETMRGWIATPGVGPFEGAAYLGLGIAVLGPVWYWFVQPVLGYFRRGAAASRAATTGFEFDRSPTADRSPAASATDPFRPDDATGSADWAAAVFGRRPQRERDPIEAALAQGDFLRSSRRSRSGPPKDEAGGAEEGAADDAGQPTPGSDRPRSDPARRRSAADGGSIAPPSPAPTASAADDTEPPGGDVRDPGRDDPPGDSGAEPAPADDPRPADPVAALGSTVAAARTHLDAAEANLAVDSNGRAESVEASLAAVAESAERRLDRLRSNLPGEAPAIGDAIAEVREAERRIEAGFEANLGDS